jgi:hypothetical protein
MFSINDCSFLSEKRPKKLIFVSYFQAQQTSWFEYCTGLLTQSTLKLFETHGWRRVFVDFGTSPDSGLDPEPESDSSVNWLFGAHGVHSGHDGQDAMV